MRPIEFRGKRIDNGEWVKGDLIHGQTGHVYILSSPGDWIHVRNDSVGQYTGLKDKNGVDVFEGDIYRVGYFALNDEKKFGKRPWVNLPDGQDEEELTTTIDELIEVEDDINSLKTLHDWIQCNPDVIGVEITGTIYDTPSEKGE